MQIDDDTYSTTFTPLRSSWNTELPDTGFGCRVEYMKIASPKKDRDPRENPVQSSPVERVGGGDYHVATERPRDLSEQRQRPTATRNRGRSNPVQRSAPLPSAPTSVPFSISRISATIKPRSADFNESSTRVLDTGSRPFDPDRAIVREVVQRGVAAT